MTSSNLVILVFAVQATLLAGLVGLWALASRRHWFFQILPIAGWFLLVRFANSPELLLLFAGQFLTIAAIAIVRRRLLRRAARRSYGGAGEVGALPWNWQISLRDALLCVLLAGLCMPTLSGLHVFPFDDHWALARAVATWVLSGICYGIVCCLAVWTAFGPAPRAPVSSTARLPGRTAHSLSRRVWFRFLVGVPAVVCLAAALGLTCDSIGTDAWLSTISVYQPYESASMMLVPTAMFLGVGQAVRLCLWRVSGWQPQAHPSLSPPDNMTTSRRSRLGRFAARTLLALSLLLTTSMLFALWWQAARTVPIPPNVPGAEQEARLAALGSKIDWSAIPAGEPDEATPAQAERFLILNTSRLSEAHHIVAGTCGAHPEYAIQGNTPGSVGGLINLARSFGVGPRAAIAAGEFGAAAIAGLDCFRLGSRGQRGGTVINKIYAYAFEGIGLRLLNKAAPKLDRQQWRWLDSELAEEEHNREPLDDVCRRQYAVDMNAYGWLGRVEYVLGRFSGARDAEPYRNRLDRMESASIADLRLLRTSLAIRFYRQDEGTFPASLAALVPNWLDAVPLDPFSGMPLSYRADEEGYSLYSIGPDGIDDGGRAVSSAELESGGDLTLDKFRLDEVAEAEWRAARAAEAAALARQQAETDAQP